MQPNTVFGQQPQFQFQSQLQAQSQAQGQFLIPFQRFPPTQVQLQSQVQGQSQGQVQGQSQVQGQVQSQGQVQGQSQVQNQVQLQLQPQLQSRFSSLATKRPPIGTILLYGAIVCIAAALVAYAISKFVVVPHRSRDCILGPWTTWSGCANGSCNGVATRTRVIQREAQYDGHQCYEPDILEVTPCSNVNACDARDCQYGEAQYLSSCSENACYDPSTGVCKEGSGEQVVWTPILREPLPGGRACDWEFMLQVLPCNVTQTCSADGPNGPPQDCSMSDWGDWSACADPGLQCALPGDPPWWSYSYRHASTSAANGGTPCNPLDMVRSQTCPQNSCTWCSLSWEDSAWSELTYPCGDATAFREADVVTTGNLPCLPQSITIASLGACALGAFDELHNSACTGYDFTIPCAEHPLSGAHQPPTLWNLVQGRSSQGIGGHVGDGIGLFANGYSYANENLGGGELAARAGLSSPLPDELAAGRVPTADPNPQGDDFRSFCLMACAEMSSCSGVLWDETLRTGSMLINTNSSEAATCAGYSSARFPQPEVFLLALDPNVLAETVAAAAQSLNSHASFEGYYALPAVVAQRRALAHGWTVATSEEVLEAAAAAAVGSVSMALPDNTLVAFSLDLSPAALAPTAPHQSYSSFLQGALTSTDLLAYDPSAASMLPAADAAVASARAAMDTSAIVQSLWINIWANAQSLYSSLASDPSANPADVEAARVAFVTATQSFDAAFNQNQNDQRLHAEAVATAAALRRAAQIIAGVWVKGVKPATPALSVVAPGLTATALSQDGRVWSALPQRFVEAKREVFFAQPSLAEWRAAFLDTGDAAAALWQVAQAAGYSPATHDQLIEAAASGLHVPGCLGIAHPSSSEYTVRPGNSAEFDHAAMLFSTEVLEGVASMSLLREDVDGLFVLTAGADFASSDALVLPPSLHAHAGSATEPDIQIGMWLYGFKPITSLSLANTVAANLATIEPFAPQTWSLAAADPQTPLPDTPSFVGGSSGAEPSTATQQTAYVWNPASTNCERVVWPMVGAACLEVCYAGTSDALTLNQGAQPVLDRGRFTATVFPLGNGKLSCPITPDMMSASGYCAPDSNGLWTSASCPLSQDCEYQSWSEAGVWGLCDATCGAGGGARYRVREITQHSTFLGTPCSMFELTESAACHVSDGYAAATNMTCDPPPSFGPNLTPPLYASSLADCENHCASTGIPLSTNPADATCTAFEYNATVNSCRIFTLPGGIDALLLQNLCAPSAEADMFEPSCPGANDCSLTTWTALNACGACEISYSYQTRSIVSAAQHGGKPCDQFPTMRSVSCGNVQSCENLPCLYGPWPTTQPQTSSADTSACLKFLATPTLFTDSWDPRYATALVNTALGAADGPQPIVSLSAMVGHFEQFRVDGGGDVVDAGPAPVSWELAQALNAQCLNSDGSAPTCLQSFPTSAAAQTVGDTAQAFLPLVEHWQGRGEVLSWGTDMSGHVGWRDVTNGGPQVFLAQFTTNVDALRMTPRVVAASLTAMGWPLATAAQVEDIAVRGARVDMPGPLGSPPATYFALIANADGSDDPQSVTTAVGGGSVTFGTLAEDVIAGPGGSASTIVGLEDIFGAWIYAPKPVQGTAFSLFAPQPFFKVNAVSPVQIASVTHWDAPPLGGTVWPQQEPLEPTDSWGWMQGSADEVALACAAQGAAGIFHYAKNAKLNTPATGCCTSLSGLSLSSFLGSAAAAAATALGGFAMSSSAGETYVFNPTRAEGFPGLTPIFSYSYAANDAGTNIALGSSGQPTQIALLQALTSCSDMGFDGMQYDSAGATGHCFFLGEGVSLAQALDLSQYTTSTAGSPLNPNTGEGWDTFVFRNVQPASFQNLAPTFPFSAAGPIVNAPELIALHDPQGVYGQTFDTMLSAVQAHLPQFRVATQDDLDASAARGGYVGQYFGYFANDPATGAVTANMQCVPAESFNGSGSFALPSNGAAADASLQGIYVVGYRPDEDAASAVLADTGFAMLPFVGTIGPTTNDLSSGYAFPQYVDQVLWRAPSSIPQLVSSCVGAGYHGLQWLADAGEAVCCAFSVSSEDALAFSSYAASSDSFYVARALAQRSGQGERGWTRIPNTQPFASALSVSEVIEDPFEAVHGIPMTELSVSQYCAVRGHAAALFCNDAVRGLGPASRGHACLDAVTQFPLRDALRPESQFPDPAYVTTVFNFGNADAYCPAATSVTPQGMIDGGIDAGWAACALERLELPGADARLMFSTTAWACPSLCPAVPSFCSWSDCDAVCSSTIYPGQRAMMRTVTQFAVGVDSLYPCSPLGVLSQTSCVAGLPVCQNDCPLGVDGSPCNTATNPLNSCDDLTGTCTCAVGLTGANCDNTCPVATNNEICGGFARGECLPSGECKCKNGWWGRTCDNVPAVMLGNSSLILALANADAQGGAMASYDFGALAALTNQGPGACSADNPTACDLCVPYTYAIQGNEVTAPWIPARYLSVVHTTTSPTVSTFADVCTNFWQSNGAAATSQTLAQIFATSAIQPAAVPATWWAYVQPQ